MMTASLEACTREEERVVIHFLGAQRFESKGDGFLLHRISSGVLTQHYRARPHAALAKAQQITNLLSEDLPHLMYSPDIVPCDYHIFELLKETLGWKKFSTDVEIKEAAHCCLQG